MPIKRLTCPHCEQSIEVQVTSVTRSRPCPSCGAAVFLQVAERSKKVKHKALLMETEEVTEPAAKVEPSAPAAAVMAPRVEEPAQPEATSSPVPSAAPADDLPYEPQKLDGDVFDRMKMDPELARHRQQFVMGIGVVVAVAAVMVAFHFYSKRQDELARAAVEGRLGLLEDAVEKGRQDPAMQKPPPQEDSPEPEASSDVSEASTGLGIAGAESAPAASAASGEVDRSDPMAVLGAFLEAGSAEERLSYSLTPGVTGPRMERFYAKHDEGLIPFRKVTDLGETQPGMQEFDVVLEDYSVRRATVLSHENAYLVDWGSFVLYNDLDFVELMEERPTAPKLVRVLVKEGKYYDGVFADSTWVRCLELRQASEPEGDPIYAYVERGSALGGEIDYWMRIGDGAFQGWTVGVKYPPGGLSNQVWLDQLVATSWVAVKRLGGS